MLDRNPPHTFDEKVEKQITTKTLSKLDLEPKCYCKNPTTMALGKNMPPKKQLSGGL